MDWAFVVKLTFEIERKKTAKQQQLQQQPQSPSGLRYSIIHDVNRFVYT